MTAYNKQQPYLVLDLSIEQLWVICFIKMKLMMMFSSIYCNSSTQQYVSRRTFAFVLFHATTLTTKDLHIKYCCVELL
jgi:hypothetical protein